MNVLLEHGTEFMYLKPINIVQAAEKDLRLRERKAENKADPDGRYSFAQRHVRRARDRTHLVALALFEKPPPIGKPSTHVIYNNTDLLRETLIALLTGKL